MRVVIVTLVLGFTLCACEQTDPAAARGAGGAVVGAPVEEEPAPQPAAVRKDQLRWDAAPAGAEAAARDASTGIPTGKRQHTSPTIAP